MTDPDKISELAALHALGALDPDESAEFENLLAAQNPQAIREASACAEVAALLAAGGSTPASPPASLRQSVLDKARAFKKREEMAARFQQLVPPSIDGFTFFRETANSDGWIDLPIPGAHVKVLSCDPVRGAAMVLGKLDPGAHYPMHKHIEAEEIYMIDGDLHIGNQLLEAGDFHRAEAGTTHGVNHSEKGCTILVVISMKDLLAQFVV